MMKILREKFLEIRGEFRHVAGRQNRFLEAFLPLLFFLFLSNVLGIKPAAGIALLTGLFFAVRDMRQRKKPIYSMGGLLVLAGSVLAVFRSGRTGAFILPNLGTNGLIVLLCLVSLPARKPFVAWTSYFARHYPLAWYWHPRVRPAYSEVTVLWALFFGTRLLLQILLLRTGRDGDLVVFSLLSGWPAIVALMAASYLYGSWRLKRLGGPGVDEFRRGDPPPWKGQIRGF